MNTSKRIALTSDPPNDCQARINKRIWRAEKAVFFRCRLVHRGEKMRDGMFQPSTVIMLQAILPPAPSLQKVDPGGVAA